MVVTAGAYTILSKKPNSSFSDKERNINEAVVETREEMSDMEFDTEVDTILWNMFCDETGS